MDIGDSLHVVQMSMGSVIFVVDFIRQESGQLCLYLITIQETDIVNNVTYSSGFVYMGRERIIDRIMSRYVY